MTVNVAARTSYSRDCASFPVSEMVAYYDSDGELAEVTARSQNGQCFGLLRGDGGCENLRSSWDAHQFEFDETHPWVGFHGRVQGDTITALGLIVYDSLSVRCRPYSDSFLVAARQVFIMFDRDGSGEIDSDELEMLQDYLTTFGGSKAEMRDIGSPLNYELFCLVVHEDLLRETDEYEGLIEEFKVFDEDKNGSISSLEQDNVSQRLLTANPAAPLDLII